jgi:hypothetical protein
MRRITTFRSTTDRIYEGGPVILYYNIMQYYTSIILEYYNTVRSESRCALRLRYVDLVVSIKVAVIHCLMS